jgi:hypothetical protein
MPTQKSPTIDGHEGVVGMGRRLEWFAFIALMFPAALVQRLKTSSA